MIELPFSPSFTLGNRAPRIYFEEIIGAVIEVKSNLKSQWNDIEKQLKFRPPNKKGIKKIYALNEFKRQIQVSTMEEISETIPAYAVGYKGFDTLDDLKQHVNARTGEGNLWIKAALQIEPALFVAGGKNIDKYSFKGPEAFGAFIASLDFELQRVVRGHSKLWKHFGINSEAT